MDTSRYFVLPLCFLVLSSQCRPSKMLNYRVLSQISATPAPAPLPFLEPATPSDQNSSVFSVLSYGAVGDGVTDDTKAFKMAWDASCQADSATILVPKHYSFMIQSTIFTGPCKNRILFQIQGSLMPPDGPHLWPKVYNKRQWLVFYRINGMSMQGGGLIDGRGQKWWDLPCKPHKRKIGTTASGPCDSPVAMRFFWSSNLTVQGLQIMNSPQFHFRFDNCHDVQINSLYIKSPAGSPNTDGIHIENSNNVQIHNSVISNASYFISDSVSLVSPNWTMTLPNGVCIGSLGIKNSRACVSNITVTDSIIKYSDNGVRIKTWQGGFGSVSKVTFKNIHMDTVRNPIIIDQYYCNTKACLNQTSAVYINDIAYKNIKGTYDVRSPPMHIACSDAMPCTNLTILDVELFPAQGKRFLAPFCWNAYGDNKTLNVPAPFFCLLKGFPESFPRIDTKNLNSKMSISRYFIVFFAIPLCFLVLSSQCRPSKMLNYRVLSQISATPSPAPLPSYEPAAPSDQNSSVFSVLSYGAVGDGVTDDTQAFKMAWDSACQADSATILVPKHYTFMIQSTIFTGPCKNQILLQIEGTLMPPDGPDSWPKIYNKRQWLAIRFFWSSNLTVQGLKIKNSPQFHFRFDNCHDVQISSLYIKSPAGSPNTDGIHIENSNDVQIHNSVISNGKIILNIGSLGMKNSRACVSNITVTDSIIKHSDNGVRIKTWQGGFGSVSKVTFNNIHMDTVRNPIIIDQYYCNTKACLNQTSAVYINDIAYKNIKGTYDVRSPPMHLACSDAMPCTNLTMSDVELFPAQGERFSDPFCWNAYGDIKTLTVPPVFCLFEGFPESFPSNDVDKC
ncbi:hypothetical protein ACJIZ3_000973 [Penstemon smallii]|uniref:Polygalacturonase n=1 Tax=Penstemon smallii TaxID=265156 RepID=A0ABD3U3I7_9LAMI